MEQIERLDRMSCRSCAAPEPSSRRGAESPNSEAYLAPALTDRLPLSRRLACPAIVLAIVLLAGCAPAAGGPSDVPGQGRANAGRDARRRTAGSRRAPTISAVARRPSPPRPPTRVRHRDPVRPAARARAVRDEPVPEGRLRRPVHVRVVCRGQPPDGSQHGHRGLADEPEGPAAALGDGPRPQLQPVRWGKPPRLDGGPSTTSASAPTSSSRCPRSRRRSKRRGDPGDRSTRRARHVARPPHVMSGFESTADPRTFESFDVTGIRVHDRSTRTGARSGAPARSRTACRRPRLRSSTSCATARG